VPQLALRESLLIGHVVLPGAGITDNAADEVKRSRRLRHFRQAAGDDRVGIRGLLLALALCVRS